MAETLLYKMGMKDILVLDDEKKILQTVAEGLAFHSRCFNVITADNGKDAIEILKAFMIDIVITNLKMLGTDSYGLKEYVKKYHPTMPVIIITARGDSVA